MGKKLFLSFFLVSVASVSGTNFYSCGEEYLDLNQELSVLVNTSRCEVKQFAIREDGQLSIPETEMSSLLITNAAFERFPAELLSVVESVFVYNSLPERSVNFFDFDNASAAVNFEVRVFHYHRNKLFKRVYTKSFEKFTECVEIDLSHNAIEHIEGDVFPSNLEKLSLAHNKISYLHLASLSTSPYLSFLDLSDNMLSNIEYGLFSSLKMLKILNLSFNGLGYLHDFTVTLRNLRKLIINGNKHTTLNSGMIQTYLKLIDFKSSIIPQGDFKLGLSGSISCPNLIHLIQQQKTHINFDFTGTSAVFNETNIFGVKCFDRDYVYYNY